MRSQKEYQERAYMKAVSMAEEGRQREREKAWGKKGIGSVGLQCKH